MRRHVLGIVHDLAAEPVARLVEVARQLGLAVDQHRIAAGMLVQIDMGEHAVMGDLEAVVDLALAVHPLAALRLAHQPGKAVLEHAGADAGQHVIAAVFLQHDGVDALQVQELGQQQPGRPAADDADLNFHFSVLPSALFCRFRSPDRWRVSPLSCTIRT